MIWVNNRERRFLSSLQGVYGYEYRRVVEVRHPDNTISVGIEPLGRALLRRLKRLLRRGMDMRNRARYWRAYGLLVDS